MHSAHNPAGRKANQIEVRDEKNNRVLDFPLFVYEQEGRLCPLKESTIGNKTKMLLEKMFPEGSVFTAHSFRHAVASQLADMGEQPKAVAEHVQIDASTVQKTYTVMVDRVYELPKGCVDKAKRLVHKLLVPWIHSKSTRKKCDCAKVLA